MTVHLVKLCVGVDSVDELAAWQAQRLAQARARGEDPVLRHITRSTPRRADDLVDGGSMFWVIRGHIRVRQPVTAVEPTINAKGLPACALILEPGLVPVAPRPHRAFQGWRYLEADDAPPDARTDASGIEDLPAGMAEELRELGLI